MCIYTNLSYKSSYLPATQKQKDLIIKLAEEKGQFVSGLDDLSKSDANYVIKDLLAVTA